MATDSRACSLALLLLYLLLSETNLHTPDGQVPVQTVLMCPNKEANCTASAQHEHCTGDNASGTDDPHTRNKPRLGNATEEGFTSQLQRTKNASLINIRTLDRSLAAHRKFQRDKVVQAAALPMTLATD